MRKSVATMCARPCADRASLGRRAPEPGWGGVPGGFVFGCPQPQRLGVVAGAQARLLTRLDVLDAIAVAASKHAIELLHFGSWRFRYRNESSPVTECWQSQRRTAQRLRRAQRHTDTFTDSWGILAASAETERLPERQLGNGSRGWTRTNSLSNSQETKAFLQNVPRISSLIDPARTNWNLPDWCQFWCQLSDCETTSPGNS